MIWDCLSFVNSLCSHTHMNITLITGPMFAGKTTHLLDLYRGEQGTKLLVKHVCDTRGVNPRFVYTHNGNCAEALVTASLLTVSIPDDTTAIYIDEGQFFNDIVAFMGVCRLKQVQRVFVAGLVYDCHQLYFGSLYLLQSMCNTITLSSTCYGCHSEDAHHTVQPKQYTNTRRVTSIEYYPVCSRCLSDPLLPHRRERGG